MKEKISRYTYINIIIANNRYEVFSCNCLRSAIITIGNGKLKKGINSLSVACNNLPREQIKSLYNHRRVFTQLCKTKELPLDRLVKKCPHNTPFIIKKLIEKIKETDFISKIERDEILGHLSKIEQTYQMLFTKPIKNGLNEMLSSEIPNLRDSEKFIKRINHHRDDINQKCRQIINELYDNEDKLYD